MKLAEPNNDFEEKILKNVKKHGYQLNGIVGSEGGEPPFMYSVGFWVTFGHPEIIIVGLHSDTAIRIFGMINEHLKEGGQHFEQDEIYAEFIEGYECGFINVIPDKIKEYLLSSCWLYGENSFPALQLVFQDENHLWPWDDEASDQFVWNQPLLGD